MQHTQAEDAAIGSVLVPLILHVLHSLLTFFPPRDDVELAELI